MTQRTLFGSTALAASLAFAPGAWAEITASDVWTAWQTQAGYYGQMTLSGTESRDGTVLTLTDVTYSGSVEEGGDFSVTIPSITLTENGDGTVNITLPEEYPPGDHGQRSQRG